MVLTTASERMGDELMRAVMSCVNAWPDQRLGLIRGPGIDQRLVATEGTVVFALHVITSTVLQASTRLGSLSPVSSVAHVLYLDHVDENIYRRVGVGRLFEPQIMGDLNSAESLDLQLV